MSPGPWIAVIVVIVVVATAYWWFTSRPLNVDTPVDSAPQDSTPADEAEEPLVDMVADEPEAAATAGGEETAGNEEAVDVVEPAVTDDAPPVNENELRLRISYSGDCWTEITDASGRRLFFDLGREGRTVELSGEAPFNVLFGNSEFVSLQVNGSDYDLSTAARRGRTARLTIAGN